MTQIKHFLRAALLLLASISYAQVPAVSDLSSIVNRNNFSHFDSHLKDLGFRYSEKSFESDGIKYEYLSKKKYKANGSEGPNLVWVKDFSDDKKLAEVIFLTGNKSIYDSMVSELIKLGYKVLEGSTSSKAKLFNKNNYLVVFVERIKLGYYIRFVSIYNYSN